MFFDHIGSGTERIIHIHHLVHVLSEIHLSYIGFYYIGRIGGMPFPDNLPPTALDVRLREGILHHTPLVQEIG